MVYRAPNPSILATVNHSGLLYGEVPQGDPAEYVTRSVSTRLSNEAEPSVSEQQARIGQDFPYEPDIGESDELPHASFDIVSEFDHFQNKFLKHETISKDRTLASGFQTEFLRVLEASSQPVDQANSKPDDYPRWSDSLAAMIKREQSGRGSPFDTESNSTESNCNRNSRQTFLRNREESNKSDFQTDFLNSTGLAASRSSGFHLRPAPSGVESLKKQLRRLQVENQRLRDNDPSGTSLPSELPNPDYTWTSVHVLDHDIFLEAPQWKDDELGQKLVANRAVGKMDLYLERHPEIAFVVYNYYDTQSIVDIDSVLTEDGILSAPEPKDRSLQLVSEDIVLVVQKLQHEVPDFQQVFPEFDPGERIKAPYMFAYHSLPYIETVRPNMTLFESDLWRQLKDCILDQYGDEYNEARECAARGVVTSRLMKYLIRPGDVIVNIKNGYTSASVATSWLSPQHRSQEGLYDAESEDIKKKLHAWQINVWSWMFDGSFQKEAQTLKLDLAVQDENEQVRISSLEIFPLKYADSAIRDVLEKRGAMFWKCRAKRFISYHDEDKSVLNTVGERYMIDISAYKKLHPNTAFSTRNFRSDIDHETMLRDEIPKHYTMLVVPPTIIAYHLRLKKWEDIHVDRITDVVWNKEAFRALVLSDKTKELVRALVTTKLQADQGTDLIRGKGSGLTILLHGGPGTGKTFTAEGVAEIAEKPLYRVTCGDVGTKPQDVEKYLESVLSLAQMWDCVVLLDEADVFLEERGLADMERNALVSVFLRILEYNGGILMLTSNRVGSFDEAFKSRIQLALHYPNLTGSQRRKIWRNFLARVHKLDPESIEYEDFLDDHLDEIVKEDMNGRQIRNVITIGRQLAQYKDQKFNFEHLKHVMETSGEFDKYLKALREGHSDDWIKRSGGLR